MRFFLDKDRNELLESAGGTPVTSLTLPRGKTTIEVLVGHSDGTGERFASGWPVIFGLKVDGKYDTTTFLASVTLTRPATDEEYYTGVINTKTAAIDALLVIDGVDTNDVASVDVMGALAWGATTDDFTETPKITVTLANEIIRGSEANSTASRGMAARVTADFIKNASTTLGTVTDLNVAIGANQWLRVSYMLLLFDDAGIDNWKLGLALPSGATLTAFTALENTPTQSKGFYSLALLNAWNGAGADNHAVVTIEATVQNGSTAGNVSLQFAQSTSDASDASVVAGSNVIASALP